MSFTDFRSYSNEIGRKILIRSLFRGRICVHAILNTLCIRFPAESKAYEHLFAVKILGAKVSVNPRTLAVAKVQISWVCDHNSLVVNKAHDNRKSSRDADGLNWVHGRISCMPFRGVCNSMIKARFMVKRCVRKILLRLKDLVKVHSILQKLLESLYWIFCHNFCSHAWRYIEN